MAALLEANPIGWLVWHLTRIQDDHVAELLHTEQLWATGDWAALWKAPLPPQGSPAGELGRHS